MSKDFLGKVICQLNTEEELNEENHRGKIPNNLKKLILRLCDLGSSVGPSHLFPPLSASTSFSPKGLRSMAWIRDLSSRHGVCSSWLPIFPT